MKRRLTNKPRLSLVASRSLVAFLAVALVAPPVVAQSFEGVLVDQKGQAIQHYPVIVSNIGGDGQSFDKVYFTDGTGQFSISDLPPGEYGVLTNYSGAPLAQLTVHTAPNGTGSGQAQSSLKDFPKVQGQIGAFDADVERIQKYIQDNTADVPKFDSRMGGTPTSTIEMGEFTFDW